MCDENKGDKTPTNEEVINELTKDLESQFTVDPKESTCDNDNSSNTTKQSYVIEPGETIPFDEDGTEEDTNADEDSKPVIPDDYVDEEALKELELTLSESDKENRHKQALELKVKGNDEFKSEKYLESINTYTEALKLCPLKYETDRSILYANRGASKSKLDRKVTAIDDCSKAIELNDKYVRAYLRRAKLYEETEKFDESLEDYKKILELDPGNHDARSASIRLPPLIEERNEKMKTEMLGKLKDLGNMILRPFGLSTENFQLQQNEAGGYSVNFKQ